MNLIALCGRLTKDSVVNESGKVADNCIAVDRQLKDRDGNKQTDFINVRWIGEKRAQFAEKYMTKGTKVIITGSLQINRFKNKDGYDRQWVYVLANNVEFAESKSSRERGSGQQQNTKLQNDYSNAGADDFMSIPDTLDEELPFS